MKQQYKGVQTIFIALLMGATFSIIILMYIGLQTFGKLSFDLNFEDTFLVLGLGIAIFAPIISATFYKMLIGKIKKEDDLIKRMGTFSSSSIVSWMFIESAILFNAVCLMLNGNAYHLIAMGFLMMVFVMKVPSKSRVAEDLKLNDEELRKL